MREDECVVVLDYTRFHESSSFKIHDLCFTVYWIGEDRSLHHEWLDYFSEAPHNYHFTVEGLMQLRNCIDFKRFPFGVRFWCDNAFKSYGCLYGVWEFAKSLGLTASLNFFAPHHGFTLCDTHFGTGKQKLRRDFTGKLIETPEDIANVFAQLNNTTVTILDEIPDHTIPKHFFEFEEGRISNYYNFFLNPEEGGYCWANANSNDWFRIEVNKQ
jgi:hypothetical protein